jgi:tetratricopeptide (TPR) repeat protein
MGAGLAEKLARPRAKSAGSKLACSRDWLPHKMRIILLVWLSVCLSCAADDRLATGNALLAAGRYTDAAVEYSAEAARLENSNTDLERLAGSLSGLGYSQMLLGRYDEAEAALHGAVNALKNIAAPNASEMLACRLELAELERARGHYVAAEAALASLQAAMENTGENAAGVGGALFAAVLRERALVFDEEGREADAIPLYERALAILKLLPAGNDNKIGILLANLANAHLARGDGAAALQLSGEAVNILEQSGNRAHPDFAIALYAHGAALHAAGENLQALHELQQALEIDRQALGPENSRIALDIEAIATCYGDLNYLNRAEAAERNALAIREKVFGPAAMVVGGTLNNLGVMLARAGRAVEAQSYLERALEIFDGLIDKERLRTTLLLGNLASLHLLEARYSATHYAKAEALYRRKLEIEEQELGPRDIRVSGTLKSLGEMLSSQRRFVEAGELYGRALAIQEKVLGPKHPDTMATAKRYTFLMRKEKALNREK